ncbi:DUF4159 domain-containing protein [Luteolibacter arcticus]|nr:DUF4159 domain-containing protein [Luteolibacter arcticus]
MNRLMKTFLILTALLLSRAFAVDWNTETIRCGNLVYGDNQTSVCFAETFLSETATETGLKIDPKFARIALATDEVFTTPLCVFTGEGDFKLKDSERANLRRYLENGGFILSSPGCSSAPWNQAFHKEIALALPGHELKEIPMDHEIFATVHKITKLNVKGGGTTRLKGIFINGRLALVHSPEGLNNAANAKGCCCCGGAEIQEAKQVNVNAVAYALLH